MTRSADHETTDRRLRLLVGLVVLAAALAVVWSVIAAISQSVASTPSVATIATLILLTTLGRSSLVKVRIRATHHSVTWTDSAILLGLATAPWPWVVLCVATGVAAASALTRQIKIKFVFGVAKDVVVSTAGGLTLILLGLTGPLERPLDHVWSLAIAYAVMTLADEISTIPVIAIAARTRIRHRFLLNWDIRLTSMCARFAVVIITLGLLAIDGRLLVGVPPLVLGLHLWHSTRMRSRAERDAWQRLASATEALNDVDVKTVLHLAVTRAAELFSADEAEVESWLGGQRRLVRGSNDGIQYDGPPEDAPADATEAIAIPLEGHDDGADVGVLRLRFRGTVKLSEREQYTLRTFASALCTAVRNASAYAELERIATDHAHAAAHDALTGLANRRALLDRGSELLTRRHNDGVLALLLIDLNHFKEVNDTLGHTAGDRVLIGVAERLRAAAGPNDVVARLGGDEFAVLLTGLPAPAVAAHRAESLLATLYDPIELDGMRISVEASGGIAVAPMPAAAWPSCYAARTWRCTRPNGRGSASPRTPGPATPPTSAGWPSAATCPERSPSTSSPSTSSRSSTWPAARSSPPRRWPAGSTLTRGIWTRCGSSRRSSAPGCCRRSPTQSSTRR